MTGRIVLACIGVVICLIWGSVYLCAALARPMPGYVPLLVTLLSMGGVFVQIFLVFLAAELMILTVTLSANYLLLVLVLRQWWPEPGEGAWTVALICTLSLGLWCILRAVRPNRFMLSEYAS